MYVQPLQFGAYSSSILYLWNMKVFRNERAILGSLELLRDLPFGNFNWVFQFQDCSSEFRLTLRTYFKKSRGNVTIRNMDMKYQTTNHKR